MRQTYTEDDVRKAWDTATGRSKAARYRAAADALGCTVATVIRRLKGRGGTAALTTSPSGPGAIEARRSIVLSVGHPATVEARTLFPSTVRDVGEEWLLKDGEHSAKIGSRVTKGPWKGFPIYTLTLEERKTCPASCRHWSSCFAPGTKVLTADLRWLPIETLAVGTRIVGFDENADLGTGRRLYRIAEVEALGRTRKICSLIETDRGQVVASDDHLWLAKHGRPRYRWIKTSGLEIGDCIQFFSEPWEQDLSYEGGRIRGFLEGEGSVGADANNGYLKSRIGWSQKPGRLFDEINQLVRNCGFEVHTYTVAEAGVRSTPISMGGINRGWREVARFLGTIRPTRLVEYTEKIINRHVVDGNGARPARVLKVTQLGRREVVEIATTTQTLVANGFLTHNCYGNHMPMARRWRQGPELEWRLRREVAALELKNATGFAIRLHNLGDFYSVGYVEMWRELLERHPALHAFGYTARVDSMEDEIAYALALLVRDYWTRASVPRFAIRFSNAPVFARSTVTLESPVQKPRDAVICPTQWTPSGKKASCCGTCGLCWDTPKRIAFIQH